MGEGARVALVLSGVSEERQTELAREGPRLEQLARISNLEFREPGGGGVGASAVLRDGTELFMPLEELMDLERERSRLRSEIGRLDGQVDGAEKKLANSSFVERAPQEVVQRERDKVTVFRDQRSKLLDKLSALERS